jgi:hypothetical protein
MIGSLTQSVSSSLETAKEMAYANSPEIGMSFGNTPEK